MRVKHAIKAVSASIAPARQALAKVKETDAPSSPLHSQLQRANSSHAIHHRDEPVVIVKVL